MHALKIAGFDEVMLKGDDGCSMTYIGFSINGRQRCIKI